MIAHDITKSIAITDDLFLFGSKVPKPTSVLKWALAGAGPLTSPGCDHGAFVKTDANLPEADLQVSSRACMHACTRDRRGTLWTPTEPEPTEGSSI